MNNVYNKDAIFQVLSENYHELKQYGVQQIGLFGSYLHGTANNLSDIDLLVDLDKDKKTLRNFLQLNYYLEELFSCKVDLITKQSLSPYIGPRILKEVEYVSFEK